MSIHSIKYTNTRSGQTRAYLYSYLSMRWLPIGLKAAELLILKGEAEIYQPAEQKKH